MSNQDLELLFQTIMAHVGHQLSAVCYRYGGAEPVNAAIECEDCDEVIFDADAPTEED